MRRFALFAVTGLLLGAPAHAASPEPPDEPDAAMAAIDRGDLAEAQALLANAPTRPASRAAAARLALMRDDLAAARSELDAALSAEPLHAPSLLLAVRLAAREGDTAAIVTRTANLANAHRDAVAAQLAYAEALLAAGSHEPALAAATRTLKLRETSIPATKLLARVYLALGRPLTAEPILLRALELERDAEALTLLAGLRHAEGKLVEARDLLEEAVTTLPGYVEALNSLGALYVEVRNWEAATGVLTRATRLTPRLVPAWINLGCAQRGAGLFSEAQASWKQALAIEPTSPEGWFNLAVLYLENPLPGRDRLDQLNEATGAFNAARRNGLVDDRLTRYLEEAALLIKQETERRENEKKQPPPAQADGAAEPASPEESAP
jgi:Tfp pilus assembly protein PilF